MGPDRSSGLVRRENWDIYLRPGALFWKNKTIGENNEKYNENKLTKI